VSTPQLPDARVRAAVSRADRQRRSRLATQALARLTPIAAAAAVVLALAARLAGWPMLVPILALAGSAVGLVIYSIYRRRTREISDPIALSIDSDANLGGELRSAHWFATNSGGDEWSAYHVEQAADRVGQVDWPSLYPPVRAMKSWAATAVLAVAAVALSVDIPGVGPKFQGAAAGPEGVAAKLAAEEIPEELRKKIEEMLAAMSADQMTARELDSKMANLKELMDQLDPAMQKKLAELLKKQPLGEDAQTKRRDLDEEDKAERGEKSQAGLPEDVRWGLEDLAARLASANLDRKTAENNPSASSETGEMGKGSQQAEMQAGGQQQMQLMREAAKDAGAAQMMSGGAGMMGGDSQAGAGGNSGQKTGQADVKSIAEALRRELVEAAADARGENVPIEDIRRKTEQGRSSLGFSKVAPLVTFDRSRTAAPPAVPVARHPLLYNYFTRKK
jgi:hypothetical protein